MTRAAGKSDLLLLRGIESGFELVPYSPNTAAEWDEFVTRSRNGTLFHERRFLAYHPPERFHDASWLVYREGRLIAVFPCALVERDGGPWWHSHPGATYGGPALAEETTLEDVAGTVLLLVRRARELGIRGIELRLSEQAFRRLPSDELEFALWRTGFVPTAIELSTTVSLLEGLDSVRRRYRDDTARSLRKACRSGLTVGWYDDFVTFWKVLDENLTRHGIRPTHSVEEIARLRDLCPEKVRLAAATMDGKLAAGVVVLAVNAVAAHTFYIAQNYEYQSARPLNAVMDFLVSWAYGRGLRYLNFGISTEQHGEVVNWGLFAFKEGFGGRGFVRTTYQAELG